MQTEQTHMSLSIDDIQKLLENVPDSATVRVAVAGESFYFARRGIELTTSPDGEFVQVQGKVGTTEQSMRPGAVIMNPDKVDFIQIVV